MNKNYEGNWINTHGYGQWSNCTFRINISGDSKFSYIMDCSGGPTKTISGTARIKDNTIHVGGHKFSVISGPEELTTPVYVGVAAMTAHWKMTVTSKQETVTYYKE